MIGNRLFLRYFSQISKMNTETILKECRKLVPELSETLHKGNCGRIGVFGGSVEFTGAPYFAALSSLRTGSDLVYVFSAASAAPIIKSYSPELMVIPHLDADEAINKIFPWLKRLHAILIGPGLGRHATVFNNIKKLIELLKVTPGEHGAHRPLVIDADGLHFLSIYPDLLKDYPGDIYLTPNVVEFNNLINVIGSKYQPTEKDIEILCKTIGQHVTIVLKGNVDLISNGKDIITCDIEGSHRRCGGQGDLLSGVLATFAAWVGIRKLANSSNASDKFTENILAAYSASFLTRTCSREAFRQHSRSMLVTDMIKQLPNAFRNNFDTLPKP